VKWWNVTDGTLRSGKSTTVGQNSWTQITSEVAEYVSGTEKPRVNSDSSGTTFYVDDVQLQEVTPGCVAADNKAFDGWYKVWAGVQYPDIYRHYDDSNEDDASRNTKDGSFYSLKFTARESGSQHHNVAWPKGFNDNEEWRNRVRGRTLTFGCWSKSGTIGHAQIGFKQHDGAWQFDSVTNTTTDWEWLEVTKTIPTDATQIQVWMQNDTADATTYFSQPMLVFGSSIGEGNYTRPQGEIVHLEKYSRIADNDTPAAADDKVLYLEVLSEGSIPKGAKAIVARSSLVNTSVTSNQGISYSKDSTGTAGFNVVNNPLVNDMFQIANGLIQCDSNGDIYQTVSEAGATLANHY